MKKDTKVSDQFRDICLRSLGEFLNLTKIVIIYI